MCLKLNYLPDFTISNNEIKFHWFFDQTMDFSTYNEEIVGMITIDRINKVDSFANIHYWIAPSMRNKGFATLALKVFIERLQPAPFKYIQFKIEKKHSASIAVAKKLGAIHYSKLNFVNHEPMSRFMKYYYLPLY
jgi:RimJ/RimL family protein N-acetyltransferase